MPYSGCFTRNFHKTRPQSPADVARNQPNSRKTEEVDASTTLDFIQQLFNSSRKRAPFDVYDICVDEDITNRRERHLLNSFDNTSDEPKDDDSCAMIQCSCVPAKRRKFGSDFSADSCKSKLIDTTFGDKFGIQFDFHTFKTFMCLMRLVDLIIDF